MAKANKTRRKSDSRHHGFNPCRLASCCSRVPKDVHHRIHPNASQKNEWKDVTCSVCMEYPHNAVLLLCSSYDKGCRPYMCATSHRFSNCLDQYKKAYAKCPSSHGSDSWYRAVEGGLDYGSGVCHNEKEITELLCPLCRGQVKGWTIVEPARKYLNKKRRTCTEDSCSFVGTYKELRKHVRAQHPLARPREVDPSVAEKWKKLEHERELDDVMSTIRSTTPGAIIIGDYVIERNNYHGFRREYDFIENNHNGFVHQLDEFDYDPSFYSSESYDRGTDGPAYSDGFFDGIYNSWDDEDFVIQSSNGMVTSARIPRLTLNRNRFLGGPRRRRRHRAVSGGR